MRTFFSICLLAMCFVVNPCLACDQGAAAAEKSDRGEGRGGGGGGGG